MKFGFRKREHHGVVIVQNIASWRRHFLFRRKKPSIKKTPNKRRMKRIDDSLRDLLDKVNHTHIRAIGVPEEEKDTEKISGGIIAENFPSMRKEIVSQVQEVQRVPYRINPRRNTSKHILIKITEIKHKKEY